MDIRGERECADCGQRWSYYETGEISCPECGSTQSVGVGERKTHTAGTASLDLTAIKGAIDDEPLEMLAEQASDQCRAYIKTVGFIHADELQPLSEEYLAACELRRVGATLSRVMQIDDSEELYFLELLRGADTGDRPGPDAVPAGLHPERGLAVAAATNAYLSDLRQFLDDREQSVDSVLSAITAHRKRVEALDGDVDPREAEQLVRAIRDLGTYLREDDETALARALDRLDTEQL
ncbi:DUF7117 family protein [Halobacteriaceae archaeon SHR40]|uniref:DUF7117 family protein n=1 Tax=Halovenus amylolytica TaxID=2500550 RepID=UPI000FE2D9D2